MLESVVGIVIGRSIRIGREMSKTTCIRNCAWAIVWDSCAGRHRYAQSVDIAFSDGAISHIGATFTGDVEEEIDGQRLFVIPGLVNIHAHPSLEPSFKGVREEHGVPEMYMTGLYERCATIEPDEDGQRAGTEVAYAELLMSGVTTLADLSFPYPGWVDLAAKSGMRLYLAPWYASSSWYVDNCHQLKFHWKKDHGHAEFEHALRLIDSLETYPSGRLRGMLYPAQIDTCTEELLRDSSEAARERGCPFTTHASQSVVEFNTMVERHGKTPIQWAHEIGILGPNTILGHAIFIDEHSWLHWPSRDDLRLLVDSRTSIAHCPTPFARYGQLLEHIGRYVSAGVNVGVGTDTTPHNILEEMRWAAVLGRIAAENMFAITTEQVFHAATVGGATALSRDDIGRLAPGAKADIVLVDLEHPLMRPARDPLRSLIYHGADRAVRDVYVDGYKVVDDGQVVTLDYHDAITRVEEAQRRMLQQVSSRDYAARSAEQMAPLSLPLRPPDR